MRKPRERTYLLSHSGPEGSNPAQAVVVAKTKPQAVKAFREIYPQRYLDTVEEKATDATGATDSQTRRGN